MNLIDRYITEVGKHLPRKNRLDIESEIRSSLEDMLEDRRQMDTETPVEEITAEIIQEFGSPRKVAVSYFTHPYLIGPRLFPIFTSVLKIVLIIVGIVLSSRSIVSMVSSNSPSIEALSLLADFMATFFTGMGYAFAYVTIIFAIIERTLPEGELEDLEDWTPEKMMSEPDPNKPRISDQIISIVFTLVGLILINFYPNVIGATIYENGEWIQVATLSQVFFNLLPWINAVGLLTIVLNIALLQTGRWQLLTRWVYIGTKIFTIAIVGVFLRGPEMLNVSQSYVIPEMIDKVISLTNTLVMPMIFVIIIIVSTVEIVRTAWKMLRKNSAAYVVSIDRK